MHQSNFVAANGGLAGAYLPITADHARALLNEHYQLTGTLQRFQTEKDDTFRVTTADGDAFVLKIANPEETGEEIDFQHGILKHIAARDPELPVPRIVPTSDGRDVVDFFDVDGQRRFVRLLTFIAGTPLCETQSSGSEREEIGRVLARLRYAMEGYSHPSEDRHYAWDVQHLLTLKPLLQEVDDAGKRLALTAGLERFRSIEPQLRRCRQQVLHNDFSKSNIVVDHDNPTFVTGIIDFGDAVKTAIAVDVSTALLNQLPETPHDDLFYRGRDIMTGYLQVAELTPEELAIIPHLVMGRVVARALLTLWRTKLFPENTQYIMRNTEQGWHQLDWFLARPPEQISEILLPFAQSNRQVR